MLDVDRITDVDQLRDVARLLARSHEYLQTKLDELRRELAQVRDQAAQGRLSLEIEQLEAFLDRTRRAFEGKLSEKRARDSETAPRPPQRGHGPRPQPKLPVDEQIYSLLEGDRACPACGGQLEEMIGQFEDSDEITVVRQHYRMLRQRRQKYRCRCNGAVVTAPGPLKLIPGGRYSIEFAVEVAAAKYLDHLPLDRQRRMMSRQGLEVDTQTLWDQIETLQRYLRPSYAALLGHILSRGQIGADETWWRVMDTKSSKRWWDWCLATEDAVFHQIHPSRSSAVVEELLRGYDGVVMTDGYAAYDTLARAGPVKHAHCWAHVRRKYIEIEEHYPQAAAEILERIGELYRIESTVPDIPDSAELRTRVRDQQSRVVVAGIRDWAFAQRSSPRSALRDALDYMLKLWPGLTRFLDDPQVTLDNNGTERALRSVVIGRKNHFGSRSVRGTQVAAVYYSLLDTARLCGLDPKDYLLKAAQAAIEQPGVAVLPQDLRPDVARA